VEVNGIELELRGSIGRLDLGGNYTLMNRANLSNNNKLTDTPKQKLFTYATWNVSEGWTVNGSFEANSMRYSSTDGKQLVPGYAVTNGKLGYRTNGGLLVEAGVRNMFDSLVFLYRRFPGSRTDVLCSIQSIDVNQESQMSSRCKSHYCRIGGVCCWR